MWYKRMPNLLMVGYINIIRGLFCGPVTWVCVCHNSLNRGGGVREGGRETLLIQSKLDKSFVALCKWPIPIGHPHLASPKRHKAVEVRLKAFRIFEGTRQKRTHLSHLENQQVHFRPGTLADQELGLLLLYQMRKMGLKLGTPQGLNHPKSIHC